MQKQLFTYITLAGLLLAIGIVGIIHRYDVPNVGAAEFEQQIEKLSLESSKLSAVTDIDRKRKAHIERTIAIIDRFNPQLPYDTKLAIAVEISSTSMKYDNLDVDLLLATITHESAFTWNPRVVSPAGAKGLMQIMPATAKYLAMIEGLQRRSIDDLLFDPVMNIRLGSRYLSSLIELYEVDGGLAAYNGGGKRAARWLAMNKRQGILFEETQQYVPAVLALYDEFKN